MNKEGHGTKDIPPSKKKKRGKNHNPPDSDSHSKRSSRSSSSSAKGMRPLTVNTPVFRDVKHSTLNQIVYDELQIWNIRGVKGPDKQLHLKAFLQRHKPLLVSLLETKLDDSSLSILQRKLGFYPSFIAAPEARICLLWHPDQIEVQVIESSRQHLHCSVLYKQSNEKILVTSIYASNSSAERQDLWATIKRISGSVGNRCWIVGGDFNEVRFSHEKVGGHPVHSRRLRRFNSCLLHSGIEDLRSIGHTMSWSNHQDNRITCRLDRVLGNQAYISTYPYSVVEYLPPGISDHSPMKVISTPLLPSGPRPFKYFEAWEASPPLSYGP
ncbi:hypothetical protein QJS10_CPA03g00797 [Acorus calamus]|uniref:Endonuclease/exonuclease/phosphatase domain-containing protein n=1 Tax=Acorus calamus TaxID=4465 RepID=A0AAV9F7L3_ACOCL|nr:hypothetical protein QJS10_CPA03g00797 [Acorus calamus]